ncbi:MAG: hypothetical protein RLN70_09930, partial [Rhodospirillaceae bacterium]
SQTLIAKGYDRGIKAFAMADLKDEIPNRRRVDHGSAICFRHRKRFFDEAMKAGAKACDRYVPVRVRGCGHDGRIGGAGQGVQRLRGMGIKLICRRFGAFGVNIENPRKTDIVAVASRAHMAAAHNAGTDDGQS